MVERREGKRRQSINYWDGHCSPGSEPKTVQFYPIIDHFFTLQQKIATISPEKKARGWKLKTIEGLVNNALEILGLFWQKVVRGRQWSNIWLMNNETITDVRNATWNENSDIDYEIKQLIEKFPPPCDETQQSFIVMNIRLPSRGTPLYFFMAFSASLESR